MARNKEKKDISFEVDKSDYAFLKKHAKLLFQKLIKAKKESGYKQDCWRMLNKIIYLRYQIRKIIISGQRRACFKTATLLLPNFN